MKLVLTLMVGAAAILGRAQDLNAVVRGNQAPAPAAPAAAVATTAAPAALVAAPAAPVAAKPPPTVKVGLTVPGLRIGAAGDMVPRLELGEGAYALTTDETGAFVIESPTGELLSIRDGKLHSSVPIAAGVVDVGGLTIGGVNQWSVAEADDFSKPVVGWSHTSTSSCGGVTMLGGYCKFAAGDVTKTVSNLPAHSQLRVQATFHFIDRWVGETAFLKMNTGVDGSMVPVWTESHAQDHEVHGMNVCGSDSVHEGKFAVRVDVTVPHSGSDINFAFGTTMNAEDPCDESWGISSFEVLTRV